MSQAQHAPTPSYYIRRLITLTKTRPSGLKPSSFGYQHNGLKTVATNCSTIASKWVQRHCERTSPSGTAGWKVSMMGMDVEFSKSTGRAKALLLAIPSGHTLVYHSPNEVYPNAIRRLLATPKVVKIGNEIACDAQKLRQVGMTEINGILDIWTLVQLHEEDKGHNVPADNIGLELMAKRYLGFRIKDGFSGNWGPDDALSDSAIQYAALDAFASLEVFRFLHNGLSAAAQRTYKQMARTQIAAARR
ncbi:hypothetical protein HDV00_007110 [Rhizophlyctis rosea]|nr:hypothetical protein HDV00_007110 [Rhizophlyctis rosea]